MRTVFVIAAILTGLTVLGASQRDPAVEACVNRELPADWQYRGDAERAALHDRATDYCNSQN